ncbi:peptidase U61 LD-carboxypeptidase A [Coriobacterium glomerans PW2]|uniref:Peptidase U61 LD-carboxypeptidase A n=1 Tax=Coriobacterium glomerans (strain ATCC 49209 / DSM 20642 / JCM 10262 / PW2) TaxID=700015 RepID=F2N6Z6_CORGP|nr:LD-carboxypeptidase [Coriobacterium glomerans]AEB06195.1 peptidase U61 LD-carboxypeptidase A [Coriobacterium glomerans PW2]
MEVTRPAMLCPGDTVGVVALGSPIYSKDAVRSSCAWWEERGFKVKLAEGLIKDGGYLAGSPKDRAKALNDMFADKDVHAVFSVRGGCGSAQIIPYLDFRAFNSNPKAFVGFSDNTSVHLAFAALSDVVTFHGPVFSYLREDTTEYTESHLFKAIAGVDPLGPVKPANPDAALCSLRSGVAEAPIIGGNLTLLCLSLGTPYEVDTRGHILFFEDTDCEPWMIINFLDQLQAAGKFDRVAGVVIGEPKNIEPGVCSAAFQQGESFLTVVRQFFRDAKFPVLYGLPLGHTKDMATIPLRVPARLDADSLTLEILEAGMTEKGSGRKRTTHETFKSRIYVSKAAELLEKAVRASLGEDAWEKICAAPIGDNAYEACRAMRKALHCNDMDWVPSAGEATDKPTCSNYENQFPETSKYEIKELKKWCAAKRKSGTNSRKATRDDHPQGYFECYLEKDCHHCKCSGENIYCYKNELDHILSYLIVKAFNAPIRDAKSRIGCNFKKTGIRLIWNELGLLPKLKVELNTTEQRDPDPDPENGTVSEHR